MAKTKSDKLSFVVSDETINCYGLRLLNAGAQTDAFKKNPVMLWMHERGVIIGKWSNLRFESDQWVADPEFDTEDEFAGKIASKVQRGFIQAVSVGIELLEVVRNEAMKCYDATKWAINEISFVDVGGNRNAVRLYNNEGEPIEDISLMLQAYTPQTPTNTNSPNTMSVNFKPIAIALGLAENATEDQITSEVLKLKADTGYKQKYEDLIKKQQDAQTAEAVKLVDAAIADNRINATQKDTYLKLFASDFESTKTILDGMQKPANLVQVANQGAQKIELAALTEGEELIKQWDALDKSGKLMDLKAGDPDKYKKMFKAKFGKEPTQ
nr:HK97 family phage prohead protease [uncultured Arsenicibacter sp.]